MQLNLHARFQRRFPLKTFVLVWIYFPGRLISVSCFQNFPDGLLERELLIDIRVPRCMTRCTDAPRAAGATRVNSRQSFFTQ